MSSEVLDEMEASDVERRLIAPIFCKEDGDTISVQLTDVDMDGSLFDVWSLIYEALDNRFVASGRILGSVTIDRIDGTDTVTDFFIFEKYRTVSYSEVKGEL